MTDFIYPQCPNCEQVAAEGSGVQLAEIHADGTFKWRCSTCHHVCRGTFAPSTAEVEWLETKETLEAKLIQKISELIPFR